MAAKTASMRRQVARTAAAVKHGSADVDVQRAEMATMSIEEYIRKIVDAAPPLTDAQRDRIAALLRPTPAGGP